MSSVATSRATQVLMQAAARPERSVSRRTSPSKAPSVTLMAVVIAAAEMRSVETTAARAASQPHGEIGSPPSRTRW